MLQLQKKQKKKGLLNHQNRLLHLRMLLSLCPRLRNRIREWNGLVIITRRWDWHGSMGT